MHVCSFISALPKAGPRHTSPPKPTVPGSPFHLQLAVRFFAPSPHPRGCMGLSAGFKIWYDVCSAKGRSMVSISTKHHPPKVCMRLRAGLKMWYHVCSWGYCIFTRWYPLSFLRRLVARLVEHVELHGESIVKPDITGLCIQSIYLFESFEQTKYINSTIQCHIN
jgi:hypothetical protein